MASRPSLPGFSECLQTSKTQEEKDEERRAYEGYKEIISTLPLENGWGSTFTLRKHQGFWIPEFFLPGILAFNDRLEPHAGDVLLASQMKSGTGWLRVLAFATINRGHEQASTEKLLQSRHAQDCATFLDGLFSFGQFPDMHVLPAPRILATHAPYSMLPESLKASDCKIVYICREPKDTLVSLWHFIKEMQPKEMEPLTLDKAFELFCRGASPYGPVWEHQLEYWQESLKRPQKVMFLRYEDLKAEPKSSLRRLAEFVGCPFLDEEEREGVVDEIIRLCSFEKLSGLEVNRVGQRGPVRNATFFRKGTVGDWIQHLRPEMAKTLEAITEQKLHGSRHSFNKVVVAHEKGGCGSTSVSQVS